MTSAVKVNQNQGSAHYKNTINEVTIIWTLDNFLEWADSKQPGFTLKSPVFSFDLGTTNNKYNFTLKIYPQGELDNDDNDKLGLYLCNKNTGTIPVKACFQFLTKDQKVIYTRQFSDWAELSNKSRGWGKAISRETLEENGLLPNDPFTIQCNISVRCSESTAVTYVTTPLPEKHSKTVVGDFAQMFADQDFSDFEIVCQGKSFPCHKNVLAARSKVFKTMLNMDGEEAKKNCLVIKDFDIFQVRQLLEFIYTGILKEDDPIGTELLLLADKYDMPDLVCRCQVSLVKDITLETSLGILDIANRLSSDYLIKVCSAFVARNLQKLMPTSEWTRIAKENPGALISVFKEIL